MRVNKESFQDKLASLVASSPRGTKQIVLRVLRETKWHASNYSIKELKHEVRGKHFLYINLLRERCFVETQIHDLKYQVVEYIRPEKHVKMEEEQIEAVQ